MPSFFPLFSFEKDCWPRPVSTLVCPSCTAGARVACLQAGQPSSEAWQAEPLLASLARELLPVARARQPRFPLNPQAGQRGLSHLVWSPRLQGRARGPRTGSLGASTGAPALLNPRKAECVPPATPAHLLRPLLVRTGAVRPPPGSRSAAARSSPEHRLHASVWSSALASAGPTAPHLPVPTLTHNVLFVQRG